MKTRIVVTGLAAAFTFFLSGPAASAADKPSVVAPAPVPPPPPVAPTPDSGPVVYGGSTVAKEADKIEKIRLRIPFTPINEDGTPGKRVLITIRIEAEDRDKALEAADQVTDRLLVQPKLDAIWDEIDEYIEDALKGVQGPAVGAPPACVPCAPAPETRPVGASDKPEGATFTPATDDEAAAEDAAEPTDVLQIIQDTAEAFDWVGPLLGIRVPVTPLTMPLRAAKPQDKPTAGDKGKVQRYEFGHFFFQINTGDLPDDDAKPQDAAEEEKPVDDYSSDPNVRIKKLLQSEELRKINEEWRRWWMTDDPSHMTYERIHGGIGP
jgi:hypothetical protein